MNQFTNPGFFDTTTITPNKTKLRQSMVSISQHTVYRGQNEFTKKPQNFPQNITNIRQFASKLLKIHEPVYTPQLFRHDNDNIKENKTETEYYGSVSYSTMVRTNPHITLQKHNNNRNSTSGLNSELRDVFNCSATNPPQLLHYLSPSFHLMGSYGNDPKHIVEGTTTKGKINAR